MCVAVGQASKMQKNGNCLEAEPFYIKLYLTIQTARYK